VETDLFSDPSTSTYEGPAVIFTLCMDMRWLTIVVVVAAMPVLQWLRSVFDTGYHVRRNLVVQTPSAQASFICSPGVMNCIYQRGAIYVDHEWPIFVSPRTLVGVFHHLDAGDAGQPQQ
jgi:hypothetical protein